MYFRHKKTCFSLPVFNKVIIAGWVRLFHLPRKILAARRYLPLVCVQKLGTRPTFFTRVCHFVQRRSTFCFVVVVVVVVVVVGRQICKHFTGRSVGR
jgi:hypothetical protein